MNKTMIKNALLFKALSDEKRLLILQLLKKHTELCACELERLTKIKQSALSYHMKILTDAKIVNTRQDGKWICYTINYKIYNSLISAINNYLKK